MADNARTLTAVVALAETFGRTLSAGAQRLYVEALADVSNEQLAAGCRCILHSQRDFMPTPGQLRAFCLLDGQTLEARALAAWEVARSNASRTYKSVRFADPILNATIRSLGGWPAFGLRCREEPGWLRRDFADIYRTHWQCGVSSELGGTLPGVEESSQDANARRLYGPPEAICIDVPYNVPVHQLSECPTNPQAIALGENH